jgi:hypothetical protein
MNKRSGFTSRFLRRYRVPEEKFDLVFGTFPNRLYVLTDSTGQYAITGEEESDYVIMQKTDKKNKYQWVLVDADTGTICFFTDLKNYMSINVVNGQINVKRSDILKNGTFTFNSDYTITLKNGYTDYCLAFKKPGNEEKTSENTTSEGTTSEGTTSDTDDKKSKEGFWSSFFKNTFEYFNEKTDIPLEVVKTKNIDLDKYSNTWKFELVFDLRDLTDNVDTINELQSANVSGDAQVNALQKLVENNKKQYETELGYKDEKIKNYNDLITRYESSWYVKSFLKEKENE